MNEAILEIKKRINIIDFIGGYISLKKAGRNFKANCPFHQEKSASFVISPDRQIWHCFGQCHEGGDAIAFLMKWEHITFAEAIRELALKTGVKIDASLADTQVEERNRLYSLNALAARYYNYVLSKTKVGEKAREYLTGRGMHEKTIETFGLGYAPSSWDSLIEYALKKRFTRQELEKVGLVVVGSGGRPYDRFRGRIVFPIWDARGNVIGFSGRLLETSKDSGGKYVNTPETMIYHKRESLYGIHLAKEAIRKSGSAILVEGEFDVISPYQQGIEHIVAVKGSAITQEQLQLLRRYCNKIVFALDADASGEDAVKRGVIEAEKLEMEIEVAEFDFAKDPDEAVRTNLPAFKKALAHTVPIYDFFISSAQKRLNLENPFEKKRFTDEIVPFVTRIQNPVIKSHYIKKIAEILAVSEDSVVSQMTRYNRKQTQKSFFKPTHAISESIDRYLTIQKFVLSLLFSQKEDLPTQFILDTLTSDDFSIPSHKTLYEAYKTYQHGQSHKTDFAATLPKELTSAFDELYLYASYEQSLDTHSIERLVYEVQYLSLKSRLRELTSGTDSDQISDTELHALSTQINEVEKRLLSV